MSGPLTFVRNAFSGNLPPMERLRSIARNLGKRTRGACCGNYGDPGC
jgi:hypothetical protein